MPHEITEYSDLVWAAIREVMLAMLEPLGDRRTPPLGDRRTPPLPVTSREDTDTGVASTGAAAGC